MQKTYSFHNNTNKFAKWQDLILLRNFWSFFTKEPGGGYDGGDGQGNEGDNLFHFSLLEKW